MTSIFSKARDYTLGNIHELLDHVADTPATLKEQIRRLEAAIDQLKSEAAIQGGSVRTMNRQMGDLQASIDTKTKAVKTRLAIPGMTTQDATVRTWAAQINASQKELDQKKIDLPAQQKVVSDLDNAVAKLETKHVDAVANVRRLESASHEADAKTHAVKALEQVGSLDSIDNQSIDNIGAKIQAKKDVADEKFDRAMGSGAFAESAEQAGDVDNLLASLK